MAKVWSPENRFRKWLEIEILVCEALALHGEIPPAALKKIKERAAFDVTSIEELEKTTKHDVVAFVYDVSRRIGEEGRFLHRGLTSSDVLDTSLALLLREATDILLGDVDALLKVIKEKGKKHLYTIMMGRTHGVHAEPITFGLKMASWYEEMRRNKQRLERAKETISYGKIAGAVGTFSSINPEVERYVCEKLALKPEPVSTQIIPRDRHGEYFVTLAIVASSVDRFAQEIRLLQRTEVREVEEFFSEGQKGSSAMPHKRNPVLSENLSGLARLMRAYALSALENIPLWHERDISHSSVERVIAPDATTLLDFMLVRFTDLLDNLLVYPEKMQENLEITQGLIFSQPVLLQLVEKGLSREEAYTLVQSNAMRSWRERRSFKELLSDDERIRSYLTAEEIDNLFRSENFLKNINFIYDRVWGDNL